MPYRHDPISNLRPILYDQPVPDAATVIESQDDAPLIDPSSATSPYSMSEFATTSEDYEGKSFDMARLRKERVDAKNHEFWVSGRVTHAVETSTEPS